MRAAPDACGVSGRNAACSHGFLQHEHVMADSAAAGVDTARQIPHERSDVAAADMHVPADERYLLDADRAGTVRHRRSVNRGFADAGAPGVEPRPLPGVFRRECHSSPADRHEPVDTGAIAGGVDRAQEERVRRKNVKGRTKKERRQTKNETKHEYNYPFTPTLFAGVVKLADARDSKSRGAYTP